MQECFSPQPFFKWMTGQDLHCNQWYPNDEASNSDTNDVAMAEPHGPVLSSNGCSSWKNVSPLLVLPLPEKEIPGKKKELVSISHRIIIGAQSNFYDLVFPPYSSGGWPWMHQLQL